MLDVGSFLLDCAGMSGRHDNSARARSNFLVLVAAMTAVVDRSPAGGSSSATGLFLRGFDFVLPAAILFARPFFTTSAIFCMTIA